MTEINSTHFYSHFSREQATQIGEKLTRAATSRIFKFAQIPQMGSVLEIGPGQGRFADLCLKNTMTYHAIEPNMQMAEELRKRGATVNIATIPPLPDFDQKFDCVVMINVMEHMAHMKDALETVSEIKNVLKTGGRLVIHSPDYVNWRHNFYVGDFSHNYVTTRPRLEQLLQSCGLTNIKSIYMSGPFTGFLSFFISVFMARMPFAMLDTLFPGKKIIHKLGKLQATFSRTILISAEVE